MVSFGMPHQKHAFTLVEIMITVLIVSILAAIAIPNILRARVQAHDSVAQTALKSISTAMETYASTEDRYPPNVSSLLGANPQYLGIDYFTGTHDGFTFTPDILTNNAYSVTATPVSTNVGSASFTISTGGHLIQN